jgi:hypothetical protein
MMLLLVLLAVLALLGWRASSRPTQSVIVDDAGVRRLRGSEPFEAVAWSQLVGVSVITTGDGPYAEDFFFALHANDGTGCLVPQGLAAGTDLLERLQRLPGFDNAALVVACGSTSEDQFFCWRGAAGAGLVAGARS